MIGRMDSILIICITTSNLKTPAYVYNLIIAVIFLLTNGSILESCRLVHETFWNYISKKCLSFSHLLCHDEKKYVSKIQNAEKQ